MNKSYNSVINTESVDFLRYVNDGKTAIDLMEDSVSDSTITINQVITRFQTLSDTFNKDNLKTLKEWSIYPKLCGRKLNPSIPPYINNEYSSFAFIENAIQIGELSLPLYHSYADHYYLFPFASKMPKYETVKHNLQQIFNFDVIENVVNLRKSFEVVYERRNFLSLKRKFAFYFTDIHNRNNVNKALSEVEKIVVMVNTIAKFEVEKYANENYIDKLTKPLNEKYCAELYATLRLISAIDFSESTKLLLYDAMAIQLANSLATLSSNSSLAICSNIGKNVAEKLIVKLDVNSKLVNENLKTLVIPEYLVDKKISKQKTLENAVKEPENNVDETITKEEKQTKLLSEDKIKAQLCNIILKTFESPLKRMETSLAKQKKGKQAVVLNLQKDIIERTITRIKTYQFKKEQKPNLYDNSENEQLTYRFYDELESLINEQERCLIELQRTNNFDSYKKLFNEYFKNIKLKQKIDEKCNNYKKFIYSIIINDLKEITENKQEKQEVVQNQ